jgi:hypothetical protein
MGRRGTGEFGLANRSFRPLRHLSARFWPCVTIPHPGSDCKSFSPFGSDSSSRTEWRLMRSQQAKTTAFRRAFAEKRSAAAMLLGRARRHTAEVMHANCFPPIERKWEVDHLGPHRPPATTLTPEDRNGYFPISAPSVSAPAPRSAPPTPSTPCQIWGRVGGADDPRLGYVRVGPV